MLNILESEGFKKSLKSKNYVFIDNDALGFMFSDFEIAKYLQELFSNNDILLDPLIKIEFLRDIYDPKQMEKRFKFLKPEIFYDVILTKDNFNHSIETSLELSKIFANKNSGGGSRPGTIDLFFMSRFIKYSDNAHLFTGNSRHFPQEVFDTKGILTHVCADSSNRTFSLLEFSKKKYQNCLQDLNKIQKS